MLAYFFVLLAVAVRFMPHPWMFTPVTGSLLFFGARGTRKQLWFPFALLVASDVVLTTLVYKYPFTVDHFVTFAWYAGVLWLGTRLGKDAKALPIIGAALASSVSFYLVTNLMAWAWLDMYPKNFAGVLMSYAAGIPFFRHALEGDLLFTSVMFATPLVLKALAGSMGARHDHSAAA
jgi:hypothetical protein